MDGSPPERLVRRSGSLSRPSNAGWQWASSHLEQALEDSRSTMFKHYSSQQGRLQEKISSMFEYLLQNRQTILSDKSVTWLQSSPDGQLSRMLAQGSTLSEGDYSPFWNAQTEERSLKLPSPAVTAYADSHLSSSSTSCESTMLNSWFSTTKKVPLTENSATTSCPLSKSFVVDEMVAEDMPPELVRTRKVKLNPTRSQKLALKTFSDAARFTYNESVRLIDNGTFKAGNKFGLKNHLVTAKGNDWVQQRAWLLDTPKAIRQQAVYEASKNFKSAFTNRSRGNISHFHVKCKRKRSNSWCIGVERNVQTGKALRSLKIFHTMMDGPMRHYGKLPFEGTPTMDCRIQKDSKGDYYLVVPVKVKRALDKVDERPVTAMDPGVRKFLTTFDNEGVCYMFGKDFKPRIARILKSIDTISSQLKDVNHQQRVRLRRKKASLYQDFANLRDEFHFKLCNFLTQKYSVILLPELDTRELSRHRDSRGRARRLRTKTVRDMLSLSHGLFRQRLRDKASENGTVILTAHEAYTSKTCSSCGKMSAVGGSETFRCRSCHLVGDRDLNAAKNILLANTYRWELPISALEVIGQLQSSMLMLSLNDMNHSLGHVATGQCDLRELPPDLQHG